jgi:hypothetical protein
MAAVDLDVARHRMAKSEHFDVLIIGAGLSGHRRGTGCNNDVPTARPLHPHKLMLLHDFAYSAYSAGRLHLGRRINRPESSSQPKSRLVSELLQAITVADMCV